MDANTLYPLLRRLEKQGLLTSDWNTDEARPRKFYRTTKDGDDLAALLISDWNSIQSSIKQARQGEQEDAGRHPMSTTTNDKDDLVDRYVYAVTRSLPESQRADIEKELRASIADAIEARIEAGEKPAAAEKAALNDLGDPMRLASEYADRPMWLIGPKYYFDWIRLLKLLFAIVLPIVFAVFFIIGFIQGGVGQAFGGAFSIIFTVAVHLAFWPTAIFALVERYGKPNRSGTRNELPDWSIDLLPELPDTQAAPGAVRPDRDRDLLARVHRRDRLAAEQLGVPGCRRPADPDPQPRPVGVLGAVHLRDHRRLGAVRGRALREPAAGPGRSLR